jgi:hypothetical protein
MDSDAEQAETHRRIDTLRQKTVAKLRAAAGERNLIAVAIRQFLDEGMDIVYSPSALWDHLSISHPDLTTQAGYDKTERERIIRIFGTVAWEKFGGGRPSPAGHPHEQADAEPGATADRPHD